MAFVGQSFRHIMSTLSDHWHVDKGNAHPNVTTAVRDRLSRRNAPHKPHEYPEDWQHPHKLSNDQKRAHARNGTYVPHNVRRVENGAYENELARDMDFLCAMMRWETAAGWMRGSEAPVATHLEVEMVEDLGVLMPEPEGGCIGLDVSHWDGVHDPNQSGLPRRFHHFDVQWKHDHTQSDLESDDISIHSLESLPQTLTSTERAGPAAAPDSTTSDPLLPSSESIEMQMLKKMFDMSTIETRLQEMVDRRIADLLKDKDKGKDHSEPEDILLKTPTQRDDTSANSKGKGVSFTAGFGKSSSAWLPKIMEDDEADGKDALDVGQANAAVKTVNPLDMSGLHKLIAEVRSVG